MVKRVYVTSAQVRAARALVERSAKTGRHVSVAIRKIANAQPETPTRRRLST